MICLLLWPYQMGMEEGNDRYSSQIKLQVAVSMCIRSCFSLKSLKPSAVTCREKVSLEDQPNAKRTLTQNRTRAPIAIMTRALFCCRSRAIICAYCGLLSTVALAQYIVQVLQIEFYFIRAVSPSLHHNSATSNWWRARIVGGVLIYICNPS